MEHNLPDMLLKEIRMFAREHVLEKICVKKSSMWRMIFCEKIGWYI